MPAYVVVERASPASRSAGETKPTWLTAQAKRAIAEHQGAILPTGESRESSGMTTIAVPDYEHATRLAEALRGLAHVSAAYPKPGEELP